MDFIMSLFANIDSLHKLSTILQWVSFGLIFLGLVSGVSKYFVDQREKQLLGDLESKKETERANRDLQFESTIKSLETEVAERKKDIVQLEKKTVPVNPYRQLIRTASATVEVLVSSDENINTQYLDSGGYLAFGRDNKAILLLTSTTCFARQTGSAQVQFKGVFDLDATSDVTKESVAFIKQATVVQIGFKPMKEKMHVLRGRAICTFNNSVRLEFTVPEQQMIKDFILIPDISKALADVKE